MAYYVKPEKTIELASYFSWFSFFLIFFVGIFFTAFIGRTVLAGLIKSQENYSLLLANRFNEQLFRRFTSPVVSGVDINFRGLGQYKILDDTVNSLLSGLRVKGVQILDKNANVVYSTDYADVSNLDMNIQGSQDFFKKTLYYQFYQENKMSYGGAFFSREIPKDTFLLSLYYPLSIDSGMANVSSGLLVLGVLKITVDLTSNYENALEIQRTIFFVFISSAILLFVLLQYIARKAKKTILERIEINRQLESQLNQQKKIAGMGRMVASVAHEIRNPLGIIRSSCELLETRNKNSLDTSSLRILNAMLDETKRLASVVDDFVDYAKPRKLAATELDLSFCINKALTFLENRISSENISLNLNFEKNILLVGEEELLYRAIYNLISNAIQAMEGAESPVLSISLYKVKGAKVILEISDNGTGFSDEVLKKALDPFFTTKNSGMGLGLPIVYSIIEAHGASLILSNNENGGACVKIQF